MSSQKKSRTVFSKDTEENILKWIASLNSQDAICKRLGCDYRTLKAYIDKNPEFAQRYKQAEHDARDSIVEGMKTQISKDWRAGQLFLTTKFYGEFGKPKGIFTKEEMYDMALRMSALIRKFVPEDKQLDFAAEVQEILLSIENKKKAEDMA